MLKLMFILKKYKAQSRLQISIKIELAPKTYNKVNNKFW